jgi:hypothetical protein
MIIIRNKIKNLPPDKCGNKSKRKCHGKGRRREKTVGVYD